MKQEHEEGGEEEQEIALEQSKDPPMSVLIARHKRLPILPQCFSTKTTSMKQEHEEGEAEEQETALEQSRDPL